MGKKNDVVRVISIFDIEVKDRYREDMGDMTGLVSSIKEDGLIQPIAVKELKVGEETKYRLLAGGRRLEAMKVLGMTEIPARIFPIDLGELSELSIELEENIRRKNLEWKEEVAIKAMIHSKQVALHSKKTLIIEGEGSDKKGHITKGWRIEDTAKLLAESKTNTQRDVYLAEALKIIPDLAKYKTKDDAFKALKGMGKLHTADVQATALKKKHETESPNEIRKVMTNAFHINSFLEHNFEKKTRKYDFISFDPPYAIDLHTVKKSKHPDLLMDAYHEMDREEYPGIMKQFLQRCYTIMAPNSWIIVWHSPEYMTMFYELLAQTGFDGRCLPAVWVKDKGQTNRPDQYLGSACEFFLYARKGKATLAKEGRNNTFIYKPVSPTRKRHKTEKPIEMMEDIITTFISPGQTMFSPCLGSGNDILAGANKGVYVEGTELTKEFKDLYINELYKEVPPNYKSYRE